MLIQGQKQILAELTNFSCVRWQIQCVCVFDLVLQSFSVKIDGEF